MGAILSNKRQERGGKDIANRLRGKSLLVCKGRGTWCWAHAMLCRDR